MSREERERRGDDNRSEIGRPLGHRLNTKKDTKHNLDNNRQANTR